MEEYVLDWNTDLARLSESMSGRFEALYAFLVETIFRPNSNSSEWHTMDEKILGLTSYKIADFFASTTSGNYELPPPRHPEDAVFVGTFYSLRLRLFKSGIVPDDQLMIFCKDRQVSIRIVNMDAQTSPITDLI